MFSSLSNIKKFVSDTTYQLTQSNTVQNVTTTVKSIPKQTKEYFYPQPEQYEMKSVVRLDDAFIVNKDIEDYITPGQQLQTKSQIPSNLVSDDVPVKPSGNANQVTSWHEFGIYIAYRNMGG